MALTTVALAKQFMGITNNAQDAQFAALVPAACAVIKAYCKRELETATYTDYLSGNGLQMLPCRQRPIQITTLTGTTTNGSPVVTGISSTSLLVVGMATSGSGIPAGSTILSVDSGTQVTLSNNATAGATTSLAFGPAVYLDPAGWAGKGPGAFSAAGLLREGFDYLVDYGPDNNTASKSGCLIRLGGGINGTTLDAIWPWEWRKGTLTVRLPPVWPAGIHNVKVTYRAGLGTDPLAAGGTLPEDLTAAANLLVAQLRVKARYGYMLTSENLAGYSYGLSLLQTSVELGDVRQILGRYRELCI